MEYLVLKIPRILRITFTHQSFDSIDWNFLKRLVGLPSLLQCLPNIVGRDACCIQESFVRAGATIVGLPRRHCQIFSMSVMSKLRRKVP